MTSSRRKTKSKKQKRHFWTRKEKIMIVEHSIAFSIQNALEKWDVNKSLVSKWTKMYNESKDRLKDSNGTNRYKTNESNNSKVKYPDIEQFAINLFTKSRETTTIPACQPIHSFYAFSDLVQSPFLLHLLYSSLTLLLYTGQRTMN